MLSVGRFQLWIVEMSIGDTHRYYRRPRAALNGGDAMSQAPTASAVHARTEPEGSERNAMNFDTAFVGSAAALAIGLTGLGAALAQGRVIAAALEGGARNPGTATTLRS